jgi:hypothetical protein
MVPLWRLTAFGIRQHGTGWESGHGNEASESNLHWVITTILSLDGGYKERCQGMLTG